MKRIKWDVTGGEYGIKIALPEQLYVVMEKGKQTTLLVLKPQDAFALMGAISLALFDYRTATGKLINEPECK